MLKPKQTTHITLPPHPPQRNLIDYSLFHGLPLQKFHEHSSTTFWAILLTAWRENISFLMEVIKRKILSLLIKSLEVA